MNDGPLVALRLADDGLACFPRHGINRLRVVVGLEAAHRLLIRPPRCEEKPRNEEVRRHAVGQCQLLGHWRHPRPRIKHMGDAMPVQHFKVFGLQEGFVANLHGVLPTRRQLIQKRIERRHEITAMLKVPSVELREFEDERAEVITEGLARVEERRAELSLEPVMHFDGRGN